MRVQRGVDRANIEQAISSRGRSRMSMKAVELGAEFVPAPAIDSGLCGLALVSGYYRIAADPLQLRHQLALSDRLAHAEDIVRAAHLLGLKSRILRDVPPRRLMSIPLPAILGL
jgi:hypothetical protein